VEYVSEEIQMKRQSFAYTLGMCVFCVLEGSRPCSLVPTTLRKIMEQETIEKLVHKF